MLPRAAGVVSWELAFLLLLRVGVLSITLHPTATDDCELHRGPRMLSWMEERPNIPYQAGKLCSEVCGANGSVSVTLTSAPALASLLWLGTSCWQHLALEPVNPSNGSLYFLLYCRYLSKIMPVPLSHEKGDMERGWGEREHGRMPRKV